MHAGDIDHACNTCRYWYGIGTGKDGDLVGECRRYAPRPTAEFEPSEAILWPLTKEGQWCGEYAPDQ